MDIVLYDNPAHPVRAAGSALGDATNGDYVMVKIPRGVNTNNWWVSMEVVNTDGARLVKGFALSPNANNDSAFGEFSIYPSAVGALDLNDTRFNLTLPAYGANGTTNCARNVSDITPGGYQRRIVIPTSPPPLGQYMSFRTSLRSDAAAFNTRVRIVLHANTTNATLNGSSLVGVEQQA
jgi:hypothetical protein